MGSAEEAEFSPASRSERAMAPNPTADSLKKKRRVRCCSWREWSSPWAENPRRFGDHGKGSGFHEKFVKIKERIGDHIEAKLGHEDAFG